ncbi:MAG: hypothetical protein ACRD2C_24535 [Acidimicrobiales bacterium]
MLKRIAVFAVAAIGLTAAPAAAQQYPPDVNSVTVSDTTPCPGDVVTVSGTVAGEGFEEGTTVVVTLDGATQLGTPSVGADGTFSLDVTIPADLTGEHTIVATGTGSDVSLSATFEVGDCDATTTTVAAGGSLPRTGSNSTMPLVRAGLALAAVGGVLLAIAAKRRRRAALA